MPFSPKIIRSRPPCGENNPRLTLELRYEFPRPQQPQETPDYQETGREIIAAAEAKANRILDNARKEAENKAKQLAKEAREEGFRQGYRQALEEARKEAEEIRNQARDVLKQAEEQRAKTLDSLEQEIIALSIDIAEKILARQLSIEPETVIAIAREAIQLVKQREKVTIFHNPADMEIFEQYREDLQRLLPANASLEFITDKIIAPGGCIVKTEHGRVEATLDSRWQAIFESLGIGRATDDS